MKKIDISHTFQYVDGPDGEHGIKCLICDLTSYNANDMTERYCGCCHVFHDTPQAKQMYAINPNFANHRVDKMTR